MVGCRMGKDKKKSMKIICPVCKTETTWEENPVRPFCSERCRIIDLGKWASEEYRIAGDVKRPSDDEHEKKPNHGGKKE